jgi:hypothetical protein
MTKVKIRNSRVEEWHNGTVRVDTPMFFEQVLDNFDATQDDDVFAEKTVGRNVSCHLASENTLVELRRQPYRISSSTQ